MLGELKQQRKWITIHHGKVELNEDGVKSFYSYVEGFLRGIYTKRRTYNGDIVIKWYIDMEDEAGDEYTITFPYESGTFKSIVLSLAADEDLTSASSIRIEPYRKNDLTKVIVWSEGVKLDWVSKLLPPVVERTIKGKTYKDTSERMAYINGLVNKITKRICQN